MQKIKASLATCFTVSLLPICVRSSSALRNAWQDNLDNNASSACSSKRNNVYFIWYTSTSSIYPQQLLCNTASIAYTTNDGLKKQVDVANTVVTAVNYFLCFFIFNSSICLWQQNLQVNKKENMYLQPGKILLQK